MLKPLGTALRGWAPGDGTRPVEPIVLLGALWAELVGPEVARNSHPAQISGDALIIVTRSSAWSQQLSFLSAQLIGLIATQIPAAGVQKLRFRVGAQPIRRIHAKPAAVEHAPLPLLHQQLPAQDAPEALGRFRAGVESMQRAKRDAGWKECGSCGVQIPPGHARVCTSCRSALRQERARVIGRLLCETPGIDFASAATQIEGLTRAAFEAEKRRLLSRWRTEIERVARDGKLSRDGRERLIASSYVLLKTGIPPERIAPATIRNELGDAVYEIIYERNEKKPNGK